MFSAFCTPAHAVTRRDDVLDSVYTSFGNDSKYASVGFAPHVSGAGSYGGSLILISPTWAITAGHVIDFDNPTTIYLGGTTTTNGTPYSIVQTHKLTTSDMPPSTAAPDFALVQVGSPVTGITPATRYFLADEVGQVGAWIGYGYTGTGSSGTTGTDFKKRGFNNLIDTTATSEFSPPHPNYLISDFDDPGNADGKNPFYGGQSSSTDSLPVEGLGADGDSGGGMFLEVVANQPMLAAITTGVTAYNAGQYGDGVSNSSYSDLLVSTRISAYNSIIDNLITHNWKTNTSGSFGTASNWSIGNLANAPAAPSTGDIVGFNIASSAYTVTLAANTTNYGLLHRQGSVTINLNGFTQNLTSTSVEGSLVVGRYSGNNATLTITNGVLNSNHANIGALSGAIGRINIGTGATWNVTGNVNLGADFLGNGGIGSLNLTSATSTVDISGTLRVNGLSSRVNYNGGSLSVGTLIIDAGRVLLGSGGGKVLRAKSLSITNSGSLDLKDNAMVIDYTTGSPDATIRSLIMSQTIRSSGTTSMGATTLGYGDNAFLHHDSFSGIDVDDSSVLVKYTYKGDADLDGDDDAHDLGLLGLHWQNSGEWIDGDFNYSGQVDFDDLYLLALDWGMGVTGPGPSLAPALEEMGLPILAPGGIVPEPASLASLAALGLCLKRSRRPRFA